jgi:bifunctional non-homologous end joining protein LigD
MKKEDQTFKSFDFFVVERKQLLQKALPKSDIILYCDHVDSEGKSLFREMKKMNLEGMIAKRKNSRYYIGKRTSDWLKIKNIQTQEAIGSTQF